MHDAPDGDGWVDTPAKFGASVVIQDAGIVTSQSVPLDERTDEQLAAIFEAQFGKKPHHKAKRETVLAALRA